MTDDNEQLELLKIDQASVALNGEVVLSLSTLALEFQSTRETIKKRLDAASVQPARFHHGHPLYRLKHCIAAWFFHSESGEFDPDKLKPIDRRAFWQSERDRLEFKKRSNELMEIFDVEQMYVSVVKEIALCFETLPDILERDAGLSINAVERLEKEIDVIRESLYQRLLALCGDVAPSRVSDVVDENTPAATTTQQGASP